MPDLTWEDGKGVPVEESERTEWAVRLASRAMASGREREAKDEDWFIESSMRSGDSFVICRLDFDGSVEVLDCLVRRRATARKANG